MSDYFQRLIEQSGLSAPPVPRSAGPAAVSAPSALPAEDLIEVHEEQLAGPVSRESPTPQSAFSVPVGTGSSISPPAIRSDVTVHTEETRRIVEETVVLPASNVAVPAGPATEIPREARPTSEDLSIDPGSKNASLPPDVFQAVMNWIAAGSTPRGDEPAPAKLTETARSPVSAPAAPTVPVTQAAQEFVPAKIPDRVIQIAEEHIHVESSPPPPPTAGDEAPPRAAIPTNGPVRVSIGSIQVRIESPATPPPAPAGPGRPFAPARSAAPAVHASGFSRLRRHYIIPH